MGEEEYPEDYDPINMDAMGLENQELRNKNTELAGALTSTGMSEEENQSLIHYQLETDKILERIEHFLKGDQVTFGEQGAYYAGPTKKVLAVEKQDKDGRKYYIQEIKDSKKGTEELKEVLVKIINSDGVEIDVQEIDSKRILEKLEKLQTKDIGYKYITIPDEDKKPLNEYGVAELMRIISMYVTKETFLSNYTEERIMEILADLADALNNFMYCNYEKMGMDTKFKESKYIMICLNLLHTVESCYRRALDSGEQEYLRTKGIVTQNMGMGGNFGRAVPQTKKRWSLANPKTW